MTQFQHLFGCFIYELRWRLFYSALAFLICLLYCYRSFEFFFFFLSLPLTCLYPLQDKYFIFTDMSEAFSTSFVCSLYFSCLFCVPLFLYSGFCFIRSSLYLSESSQICYQVLYILFSLAFSLIFCYFISLPVFWNFFISFDEEQSSNLLSLSRLRLEARISTYISLTLKIFVLHHLLFFLPVVVFFVQKLVNFSTKNLARFRRRCFLLNLFIAAAISPPDLILQAFLFLIFCSLTEIVFGSFLLYDNLKKLSK